MKLFVWYIFSSHLTLLSFCSVITAVRAERRGSGCVVDMSSLLQLQQLQTRLEASPLQSLTCAGWSSGSSYQQGVNQQRSSCYSFLIRSRHCGCFFPCRLSTPEILQWWWFWTLYEKSAWIHSAQPASIIPPSSSCGSNDDFFHSCLQFPLTSCHVSPRRVWTAAATSRCTLSYSLSPQCIFKSISGCCSLYCAYNTTLCFISELSLQVLSRVQPHMTHSGQMFVYTHFIKAFLTRQNTTGRDVDISEDIYYWCKLTKCKECNI